MDFFKIREKHLKTGQIEIYPDFNVELSTDLMIRGRAFYAIWDQRKGLWSTNEHDVQRLMDQELYDYAHNYHPDLDNEGVIVKTMASFDNGYLTKYRKFVMSMPDNAKMLDNKIAFANTPVKKTDYISKRLSYDIQNSPIDSYDELMSVLYSPEERQKLEWAIGSIISGDSKDIQKFIVLYGEAGSGKSTFLNIVQQLFEGYYTTFDAKSLVGNNNAFATETFRTNALIAIQHDGDLSKIEDNTKLNSIVSHEDIIINEKYKQSYASRANCFLFMGTNQSVKITNARSGLIRRLIDVRPKGDRIVASKFSQLVERIKFESSGIANHCLNVYRGLGKNYYDSYRAQDMILQTNVFYNFVEDNFFFFKENDITTLSQAYTMYKAFCEDSNVSFVLPKHSFREELKAYFKRFYNMKKFDNKQTRNVYCGFLVEKFVMDRDGDEDKPQGLLLISRYSRFDEECIECPSQYATNDGIPKARWKDVETTLNDIDTSELHYVRVPENHIVIDFDIKDDKGEKSLEMNLIAAANWPTTYAEYSKSGKGIHLHYIYDGDVSKLKPIYDDNIEVKVFSGNSALRRKLTLCNSEPINHISTGLPLKGEKMITVSQIKSEQGLRKLIQKNLNKEIHAGTKPSVDFIYKILEDAHNSDLKYDVSDMRQKVLTFAMNSTNNSEYCVQRVNTMQFISKIENVSVDDIGSETLVFYDVEVFPNLFIIVYKAAGKDKKPVQMINPTPLEIEPLLSFKLVGFNCRRYDNHIIYAAYLGYTNQQLYDLSQKIINGGDGKSAMFGEAYNLSYTDVYDFCSVKQSLKRWQIDLDLDHIEVAYKWDQPVPKENWQEVADYCSNDVISTEAVFNERQGDFIARQILADLSGGSVNDTTNQLTTKLIFGDDRHPKLIYTDLATGEQS